jgi:hypothetical protein
MHSEAYGSTLSGSAAYVGMYDIDATITLMYLNMPSGYRNDCDLGLIYPMITPVLDVRTISLVCPCSMHVKTITSHCACNMHVMPHVQRT